MAVFVAAKFRPAGDTVGMAKDQALAMPRRLLPIAGLADRSRSECEDMVIKKPP
jgi:hypothetical protein